jgi:hypothetical protein
MLPILVPRPLALLILQQQLLPLWQLAEQPLLLALPAARLKFRPELRAVRRLPVQLVLPWA